MATTNRRYYAVEYTASAPIMLHERATVRAFRTRAARDSYVEEFGFSEARQPLAYHEAAALMAKILNSSTGEPQGNGRECLAQISTSSLSGR